MNRNDDILLASRLVLDDQPFYGVCSDVNALRDSVPCSHCTCWFGTDVNKILAVVDEIREPWGDDAPVKP